MTQDEFKMLKRGDIIINDSSGVSYVVLEELQPQGKDIIVTRTIRAMNPGEWSRVLRRRKEIKG